MSEIQLTENIDVEICDDNDSSSRSPINAVIKSIKDYATIAEVMRIVGAIIMMASMTTLLFKGWHDGDDMHRYLKLLSFTGLLSIFGLALSYIVKEQKGARVFFWLGHLSVPINFGILGALLYSVMPESGVAANYPGFAKWIIADFSSIVIMMLGGLVILIPVSLLGFKILNRSEARLFTLTFIGLNGLLLLPFRSSLIVGIILAVAMLVPFFIVRSVTDKPSYIASIQAKLGIAMLFVPALILLARNLYLYQLDSFLALIFHAGLYLALRQYCIGKESGALSYVGTILSLPVAIAVAICSAELLSGHFDEMLMYTLFSIILGGYMVDTNLRLKKKASNKVTWIKSLVLIIPAILIGGVVTFSILVDSSVQAVVMHIVAGAGLLALGLWIKSRVITGIAILVTSFALWNGFQDMIHLLFTGNWIALASLGGIIIVSASIVDRYGVLIKCWVSQRLNKKELQEDFSV